MKIIISPAKKMVVNTDILEHHHHPVFMKETEELLHYLQDLDYEELKNLWNCSHKIAQLNYVRINKMNLYHELTPAIFSYEGLQYQYMAPKVLGRDELEYINEHLRILSGFYGIIKPFDGVVPYRLEMQAKPIRWKYRSLYDFWKDKIAKSLFSESKYILNLASKEYSKCISNFIEEGGKLITCIFGEIINEKVIEKGTFAKMARGEMVRFMAENKIEDIENIKKFDRLGYEFNQELSNESNLVFIKK